IKVLLYINHEKTGMTFIIPVFHQNTFPIATKANTTIKLANSTDTIKLKIGNVFFSFFLNNSLKLITIFNGTNMK
ncbi:hypothetical protein, partial [Bacillus pseudomycoides]|uniref:hypothetical protein n=1 Tax=Bacillus pseudomycoides TaxID=64104 RepID=UPI002FFDB96E